MQITNSHFVVYGLGLNSPQIIRTIWYGQNEPEQNVYTLLVHNVWQSLVVVSIGAIVGITITFVAINRLGRKWIQMIGFFWLFILFIVIGGSFYHLYEIGGQAAIVVLYILCQIFFNFGTSELFLLAKLTVPGPNATTYIVRQQPPRFSARD
jgi:PHS family inorganic phosphate transporter-like MFS transporter